MKIPRLELQVTTGVLHPHLNAEGVEVNARWCVDGIEYGCTNRMVSTSNLSTSREVAEATLRNCQLVVDQFHDWLKEHHAEVG